MPGPLILLKQLADGEGAGGFVSVDAGGNIDALCVWGLWSSLAGEDEQTGFWRIRKLFDGPAVLTGGGGAIGEDGVYIERFAEVTVEIFTETLHCQKFQTPNSKLQPRRLSGFRNFKSQAPNPS